MKRAADHEGDEDEGAKKAMKRESLHEEKRPEHLSMGSCDGQGGHESETDTKQDSEATYVSYATTSSEIQPLQPDQDYHDRDLQEDFVYVNKYAFAYHREQIEKAQKFYEKHIVVPAEPLSAYWAHERANDLVDGWQDLERSCERSQRIKAIVLMFKHQRVTDKPWQEGLDGTRFMPFPEPDSYGAEQAKKFVNSELAELSD